MKVQKIIKHLKAINIVEPKSGARVKLKHIRFITKRDKKSHKNIPEDCIVVIGTAAVMKEKIQINKYGFSVLIKESEMNGAKLKILTKNIINHFQHRISGHATSIKRQSWQGSRLTKKFRRS